MSIPGKGRYVEIRDISDCRGDGGGGRGGLFGGSVVLS